MKTDQEIINYFCEIMHPFPKKKVQIHENNKRYVRFSIPHDAYGLIIFKLLNEFLCENKNQELDIISSGPRLMIHANYPEAYKIHDL